MRIKFERLIAILVILFAVSVIAQSEELENNTTPEAQTEATEQPEAVTGEAAAPAADAEASSSANTEVFVNSKTAFELQSTDDLSTVDYIEYKVNNGEFTKYSSPITLSDEGANKITYRAVDKAENRESSKVLVITVDNSAPIVKLVPSSNMFESSNGERYVAAGTTMKLKAEDNISGVKTLEYSLNGSEKTAYTTEINLSKAGSNILKYSAKDNADNTTAEETYIVTVDDGKPRVEIKPSLPTVTIDGKVYSRKGANYAVIGIDKHSGIKQLLVKIDGETEFAPYAEAIMLLTAGEHTISAKAIDNVGNESDVVTMNLMVDIMPPKTMIKKVVPAEPAQ